jgi:hypothetical protein
VWPAAPSGHDCFHRVDQPVVELSLKCRHIGRQQQSARANVPMGRACEASADIDASADRQTEIVLQVAHDGYNRQGTKWDLSRHSLHRPGDTRHVVLGEQIVEPLAIDAQRKGSHANIVRSHGKYPLQLGGRP